MAADYHRILMLFVDGVGLAPTSVDNPFSTVPTPAIEALLGGPLTAEREQIGEGLVLRPLDATLGIEGLPQSATGQASLFSGVNGAERLGRHQTGLPGPRMRQLVETHGLLLRARQAGLAVTFANAYTTGYLEEIASGGLRPSVTTCAALAANVELPKIAELKQGRAVAWDFCRDRFATRAEEDLQPIPARLAGMHLAQIASSLDLTVHETFLTDLAGHLKRGVPPEEAVERLDEVIAGLEAERPPDLTWILTSDHGNLEDVSVGTHTRNPVPLLAVGPAAGQFAAARSILDFTPLILAALGVPG